MLAIDFAKPAWEVFMEIWLDHDRWVIEKDREWKTKERKQILDLISTRTWLHLIRLFERKNTVEHDFAVACISCYERNMAPNRVTESFISDESASVCLFRTHAPYIMKRLLTLSASTWSQLNEQNALTMIFHRAQQGITKNNDYDYYNKVILPGLEWFSNENDPPSHYILDVNPHHISHQVADFFGKRIAELLLQK